MTLSILTNRKPVSLVFSTVLLAVLLVVAGSHYALSQSTAAHRPPAGLTGPPIAFASPDLPHPCRVAVRFKVLSPDLGVALIG
jgi:hypothetical protein